MSLVRKLRDELIGLLSKELKSPARIISVLLERKLRAEFTFLQACSNILPHK